MSPMPYVKVVLFSCLQVFEIGQILFLIFMNFVYCWYFSSVTFPPGHLDSLPFQLRPSWNPCLHGLLTQINSSIK